MNGVHRTVEEVGSTEELDLMDRLDQEILNAEEEDVLGRIDRDIAYTENAQILNDEQERSIFIARGDRLHASWLNRFNETTAPNGTQGIEPNSIQQVRFIRAKKRIPRNKKNKASKMMVKETLLGDFQANEATRLTQSDMRGFELSIVSASPNAWRIEVVGFEKAVNGFLSTLRRQVIPPKF